MRYSAQSWSSQTRSLDELEHAIAEREDGCDTNLGGVQVVEIRDDPMKVWPPRVKVDGAKHALCKPAEVVIDMKEQVDAGSEQEGAPNDPLGGDQAEDAAGTRLVASSSHGVRQSRRRVGLRPDRTS